MTTSVTKCTPYDIVKLERLVKYIRYSKTRGLLLRPGALGIHVSIFVDAAYGVHEDRTSHTRSCVAIGDRDAVHCKSCKKGSVTKSRTEAELIALSDSSIQALYSRH